VTPLALGHGFFHGDAGRAWVPAGDRLVAALLEQASAASGRTLVPAPEFPSWWVMTLTESYAADGLDEHGTVVALGDHNEGARLEHWTVLAALNDLPDDAGGEFRLVAGRDGPEVSPRYPHKRGRGLMFRSQHWHGNLPLAYACDRVTLALIAVEA
jgi:hypothetical protein